MSEELITNPTDELFLRNAKKPYPCRYILCTYVFRLEFIDKDYMDTKRDIPFVLESVDYEDSYQGALTDRRRIIYTLKFTAKIYLYGPISSSAVITKVSADLYTDLQAENPSRSERVTVTPNPTSADKDDVYTYTETLEFFNDGLNYDEGTGNDK